MQDDSSLLRSGRLPPPAAPWDRAGSPPSVFTAFVRSQQGSETPDTALLHGAWDGLQAALGAELKRRGLWHSPPCYLGLYGYERWDAEETVGDPLSHARSQTRPAQSALEELVTDCWAFVFSDRMRSLKLQLAEKENIEGLVLRNVRNFLHERQREHDPVGFRVFERLKGALAEAVAHGGLHVLGGDPRIRNNTVFGAAPAAELRLPDRDLRPLVERWNDELLPGLVTARGRREAEVSARLEELLLELPRQGVPCFRFKDLIDPLKSDARQRWAAFLERDGAAGPVAGAPGPGRTPRQAAPESAVESRQRLEHLSRCVSASIARVEVDPRTRGYLASLWSYLQRKNGVRLEEVTAGDATETADGPLSHRMLSQRLQIPRDRMPVLFTALQQLVTRCRLGDCTRQGGGPARSSVR